MSGKAMEKAQDRATGEDAPDARRPEAQGEGGLRDDMAALAARIETLALDVARLGRGGLREAAGALEARGERLAGDVERQLAAVEARAATLVRERPVQALGSAAR